MGVMAMRGITGDGASGEAKEPETAPEGQVAPAADPIPQAIPLPTPESVRKPGSRRDRAEQELNERIEARFKDFESKVGQERQTYEQKIQEQQREMARMQGMLEEMRARPMVQPQTPAPQPAGPDPADLRRQAKKALAENNLDEYERLTSQATIIEADQRFEAKLKSHREELEKRIPAQVPAHIQSLIYSNQNVAQAGPQGMQWVQIKDNELALRGVPQGPDRLKKAFELADKEIESMRKPAPTHSYDQRAASALSAVPTSRPAGGGGGGTANEPTYQPTEADREVIRSVFKGDAKEWMKWKHPERWMKR